MNVTPTGATPTTTTLPLNVKNMVGERFSRLVVIAYHGQRRKNAEWLCSCDCEPGKTTLALRCYLVSGDKKSCGCLDREYKASLVTHGATDTVEFKIWGGMKNRCENPNCENYSDYGGRGIYLCDEWQHFENFLRDMGLRPSVNMTIERIDNSGPYSKENCRWATKKDQGRNKRSNHLVRSGDEIHPISYWTELKGYRKNTILNRLAMGWSEEGAIMTPDQMKMKKPRAN